MDIRNPKPGVETAVSELGAKFFACWSRQHDAKVYGWRVVDGGIECCVSYVTGAGRRRRVFGIGPIYKDRDYAYRAALIQAVTDEINHAYKTQ